MTDERLKEIKDVNSYEYFKEMTENWNREDFSRRCYDLCNEKVDLQARIDKAVEYIEEFYDRNQEVIDAFNFEYSYKHIADILRGKDK